MSSLYKLQLQLSPVLGVLVFGATIQANFSKGEKPEAENLTTLLKKVQGRLGSFFNIM
jgi:hypothetical protein